MVDELNYSTGNKHVDLKMNFDMGVESVETLCYFAHPECTQTFNLAKVNPFEDINQSRVVHLFSNMENNYMANDNGTIYKTVKTGNFELSPNFNEPKLNISNFEGCPHIYGKIYWNGVIYEIQQKITETYLEEGKKTGGDWTGYKVGDFTQRFLSKESLNRAFEMIKVMMI